MADVAVWRGRFGEDQAERLLWRAGFGPRPGEAQALARHGLEGAVHELTHPGRDHLVGHKPHDEKGRPLAPYDAWGQDHVWWLDRMVRTSRPLVERMALDLARLVRDIEHRRRFATADAEAERALP